MASPSLPGSGASWVVGIDVGGTFTDAVAVGPGGELVLAKVLSTPRDLATGLLQALGELLAAGVPANEVRLVFHGTTVATNAVLTGGLAPVTLLATAGATDVLAYRTGRRPRMYDLRQPRPAELIPAERRLAVAERVCFDGSVREPLGAAEIDRLLDRLADLQPPAVAIALLFSYRNGEHEQRLASAVRERFPDAAVAVSSEIAREFREYPRTATTVINAGLRPVVGRYIERAARELRARLPGAHLLVMQSSGGSVPADRAANEAHRLLVSGPAGGVAGAVEIAGPLGALDLIALDMGGTSTDVSLVRHGIPQVVSEQEVNGHPVLAPAIDIRAIGAGGGSIVSVDAGGSLMVGPESAGSDPGPASYARGGTRPTITDAHVVCGTLGESTRLAGRLPLDPGAAMAAFAPLAGQLGMPVIDVAEAALAVTTANLIRAIRAVSVERGVDPGGCQLVAFGGAGPLHAGRLVRELGLAGAIVPPSPGLLSAHGLLVADVRYDDAQTDLRRLDSATEAHLVAWFATARDRLARRLEDDGIGRPDQRYEARADCRYLGQGYELVIAAGAGGREDVAAIGSRFHAAHAAAYGHSAPDEVVEVVTVRLTAYGILPRQAPSTVAAGSSEPPSGAIVERRPVLLPGRPGPEAVPVYRRSALLAGNRLLGPAVLHQLDATTVVLAGQAATVDEWGNVHLREVMA